MLGDNRSIAFGLENPYQQRKYSVVSLEIALDIRTGSDERAERRSALKGSLLIIQALSSPNPYYL